MDSAKRSALKTELADQPEPLLVDLARFFDGNDDEGSIGCNLFPHPGMSLFRDTLVGLQQRSDVQEVYAWVTEIDPDDDAWPFSDTILVAGSIEAETLRSALEDLHPDEVDLVDRDELGDALPADRRALVAWWD